MVYLKYLKYILNHKLQVFKICLKERDLLHGITHDLSKFRPSEFFPYAHYYYGKYGTKVNVEKLIPVKDDYILIKHILCKESMNKAWRKHYFRNKHHWNYWLDDEGNPINIPVKYLYHMYYDISAMSVVFGDTPQEFYFNNINNIKITRRTRLEFEKILGFISTDSVITWQEYCDKNEISLKDDLNVILNKY